MKELFLDRQVLARILKRVTTEFKDERIDDIISAIEGEPEIETVPVEPGLTNAKGMLPEADYGMKRTFELESKVDGMCDYSIGIARKNYMQGEAQGKNELVEVVQRLRKGESREEIIKSGIDEHTVDLAITIK